jgi:hypothetical protein
VGWGSQPYFSEFAADGKTVFDARLPGPDLSYRVYLGPWAGQPLGPPSGAARRNGSTTTVYASWNGATKVASWRVLGGASGQLATASRGRAGFETAIPVTSTDSAFRVQALDARGRVLGTSRAFSVR